VLRCTAAYITVVPQHAVRLYCSVQYGHTTAFAARFSLLNKLFAEQGAMLTHGPLSACRRRRATSLRQLYRHSCTAAPPICASCTAESLPRCGTGSQALWRAVSVAPPGIRAAAAARSDCSSRPLSLQQQPALTAAGRPRPQQSRTCTHQALTEPTQIWWAAAAPVPQVPPACARRCLLLDVTVRCAEGGCAVSGCAMVARRAAGRGTSCLWEH